MLSLEESEYYVTEVLKVSPSLLQKKKENGLEFLTATLKAANVHLPLQTATLIAMEPSSRCRPSLEDIKQDVLAGKGGLCYTISVFVKNLLEALGFDVFYVAAKVKGAINHISVIVANVVKAGDQFYFDPALGYPNFEPIPLDFEIQSNVYHHSYMIYKFIREGEYIVRCHKKSSEKNSDPLELPGIWNEDWKKVVYVDLTPRELEYFDDTMDAIYKDIDGKLTPFHTVLRIVGFAENNLRAVFIKDASILLENDCSKLDEIKIHSLEEMMKYVEEYYPSLKTDATLSLKRLNLL